LHVSRIPETIDFARPRRRVIRWPKCDPLELYAQQLGGAALRNSEETGYKTPVQNVPVVPNVPLTCDQIVLGPGKLLKERKRINPKNSLLRYSKFDPLTVQSTGVTPARSKRSTRSTATLRSNRLIQLRIGWELPRSGNSRNVEMRNARHCRSVRRDTITKHDPRFSPRLIVTST
jgi:hypothetical protein